MGTNAPENVSVLSKLIFGTSLLGNLYSAPTFASKKGIVSQILEAELPDVKVFDCAGKYGAGLALEVLGQILQELNVDRHRFLISNKLGWKRIPLTAGAEPTFEPGIWKELQHDAVQDISYNGMMTCFHQGNALLGGGLVVDLVSVHDPEEYLAQAKDDPELLRVKQYDLVQAYTALFDLKEKGLVKCVGVGSKSIDTLDYVTSLFSLDWVMVACCLTPYTHTAEIQQLLQRLSDQNVHVINAGLFHGGFLVGQPFFNYRSVSEDSDPALFEWRRRFQDICDEFDVSPAEVCVQFSFRFPGIGSVALNADSAARVQENYRLVYGPTTIGATTRTARHLTENSSTDGDYHNDEVQWEGLWIRLFTAELTLF